MIRPVRSPCFMSSLLIVLLSRLVLLVLVISRFLDRDVLTLGPGGEALLGRRALRRFRHARDERAGVVTVLSF